MTSVFMALLNRLRDTNRWSGMMSLQVEDVAQHSYNVALIALMLCEIDKAVYKKNPNTEKVLAAALLHDGTEAILTDVVAPVKKYSPEVESAFRHLEDVAESQLVNSLPRVLQGVFKEHFDSRDQEIDDYVHAADKIDALSKCKSELRRGNQDFVIAANQIQQSVAGYAERMPCVQYFTEVFLPAFDYSVDEYRYLETDEGVSQNDIDEIR